MGREAGFGAVGWSHGFDDYISTLAWAPDGRSLVAASLSGEVRLLDGHDGSVSAKVAAHPLGVLDAAWSADGARLATGGADGILRIHRCDGGPAAEIQTGAWVEALAWRGDGSLLAAGSGREVRLLDRDGEVVITSEPARSTITSLAWSRDGRRVGAGCYGGVGWYEPEHGARPIKHFEWKGSVLTLAVSPDGRWLTAGAQDQSIHIWRLWSADDLEMSGYATKVEHLSWHHSSRYMAVGNMGEITVWDFSGRGPQGSRPRQTDAHDRHITALAFAHRSDLLASGGADGAVRLCDGTSRGLRAVDQVDLGGPVSRVAWSPDDTHLAVATADGRVTCHALDR